jgi:hypothetical protein
MTTWIIYCHTHKDTGREYIGLTKKTMLQRWNRHVYSAIRVKNGKLINNHFTNAIRKYGKDAFEHRILERDVQTLEEANALEEFLIEERHTRDLRFGFNLMKGGGYRPNPIRKNPWDDSKYRVKLISIFKKPEYRKKLSIASKNMDPEIRAKIGLKNRGVDKFTPEIRAKIASTYEKKRQERWYRPISMDCKKHGVLPADLCLIGKRISGSIRIECKLCCRERSTDRHKNEDTYNTRKKAGLCTRCGHNKPVTGVMCNICRDRRNEKRRVSVIAA